MNSPLWIMFGLETFQCRVDVIVHRDGYLEDIERVSINMFERMFLLVLYRFLEGADVLRILDLDCEKVTGTVAENKAVDVEVMMREGCLEGWS